MAGDWDSSAIEAGLREAAAAIKAGGRRGLQREGERILGESQAIVPVDTGELRASGMVAVADGRVAIGYSDSKAVAAHEDLRGRNKTGQAKYLEQPLTSDPGRVGAGIAQEIREGLG